jgi:hypothetical protein
MKKAHIITIFGIFAIASFVAVNMYTSTSFPGFSSNKSCNYCHNQPAYAKSVQASLNLSDWNAYKPFNDNSLWTRNEVPIIQTNNRSESNLEFIAVTFMKNTTHMMVMASITDVTAGTTSKSTSDKFAIIFNIDVINFTVGDFLTSYNSSSTNEDDTLTGQMGFKNGHADMWYVDTSSQALNSSGIAMDYYISSNYQSDGTDKQDVSYGLHYGAVAHDGSKGYRFFFVRPLTTSDNNDVQFNIEGQGIYYAIAYWNNSRFTYHLSSFDQMVVVGDKLLTPTTVTNEKTVTNNVSVTVTTTETSASTSSFTMVFVLAGLLVAIPVIANMRRRKV